MISGPPFLKLNTNCLYTHEEPAGNDAVYENMMSLMSVSTNVSLTFPTAFSHIKQSVKIVSVKENELEI